MKCQSKVEVIYKLRIRLGRAWQGRAGLGLCKLENLSPPHHVNGKLMGVGTLH